MGTSLLERHLNLKDPYGNNFHLRSVFGRFKLQSDCWIAVSKIKELLTSEIVLCRNARTRVKLLFNILLKELNRLNSLSFSL